MNDETNHCPRCSDYDKVKQELESNKFQREKQTKDALKHCKESKAKLQKKLLTFGAIAIVAGTLLGKDFVDTIVDYIESFNKVKDTATKLLSTSKNDASSSSGSIPPNVVPEVSNDNQQVDAFQHTTDTWGGFAYTMTDNLFSKDWQMPVKGMSLSEVIALTSFDDDKNKQEMFSMTTYDDISTTATLSRMMYDLIAFPHTMNNTSFIPYSDNERYSIGAMMNRTMPTIVPSPTTLSILLYGLSSSSLKNSRRRTL